MRRLKKRIALPAASIVLIAAIVSALIRVSFLSPNKETGREEEKAAREEKPLPFEIGEKFLYRVNYGIIKVGEIEFEYLGREKIDGIWQDVIRLGSNVNILRLFQIESEELVYIDADTYLPVKVQRRVNYSGTRELILEIYQQEEGRVRITQEKDGITEEKLLEAEPPIHNALALYFLYPFELEAEALGETYEFNLPTRKINIKLKKLERVPARETVEEFYILESLPPRRFRIWLNKTERMPQRIEIRAFLGKIVITRI